MFLQNYYVHKKYKLFPESTSTSNASSCIIGLPHFPFLLICAIVNLYSWFEIHDRNSSLLRLITISWNVMESTPVSRFAINRSSSTQLPRSLFRGFRNRHCILQRFSATGCISVCDSDLMGGMQRRQAKGLTRALRAQGLWRWPRN